MKRFMQISKGSITLLFSFFLILGAITFSPYVSHANELHSKVKKRPHAKGDFCHKVKAKIESFWFVDGCESPLGSCTAGEITKGGLLNGPTVWTAEGMAYAAGISYIEPDANLSYSGILKVQTKKGTLTFSDLGTMDAALGVYSETDRLIEGTGRYEGAKGVVFIFGEITATGFTGDIRGEICISD